ncbi:unnamed protein product [Caenorhabditis auriculariae]|uniref:Uncharacterized protein n=1 Tax=Caenorhabditis auriculariae TaxID=2777116 RepID=A0A8S1HI94_9PELO|nr:unnamed protein product [Caenorhabditis auriculariae]
MASAGRPHSSEVACYGLERSRASVEAKKKLFLMLLVTEDAHVASPLHAGGLNYFYWYKQYVDLRSTIEELFGDSAQKEFFSEHEGQKFERQESWS